MSWKKVGTTVSGNGSITTVLECEECGYRTIHKQNHCPACWYNEKVDVERSHEEAVAKWHREEAEVDLL